MKEDLICSRDDILAWITKEQDALLGLLSEMISIPSENRQPDGQELPLQQFLLRFLKAIDYRVEAYDLREVDGLDSHIAYWPGRNYENRPNIYAVCKGKGGEGKSLLFSVHADVVLGISGLVCPDPFTAVVQDNRVYGRGACDMKGGIAAILMALRFIKEQGISLQGDLAFESVVDEEAGGANGTLAGRLRGHHADAAIIPEPTNMRVCQSNMGGTTWRIQVKGKGGMSFGGEETLNPIYAMAEMVRAIEGYERDMRQRKKFVNPLGETQMPQVVLSSFRSGEFEAGMADGIPESCEIEVWVECLAGETLEDLEREFIDGVIRPITSQSNMESFQIGWDLITRFLPGTSVETPIADVMMAMVSDQCDLPQGHYVAPFACDSFMFNLYSDTPAVIFGPTGENAHAADEFVDIESLIQLTTVYIQTILTWCVPVKQ